MTTSFFGMMLGSSVYIDWPFEGTSFLHLYARVKRIHQMSPQCLYPVSLRPLYLSTRRHVQGILCLSFRAS